ncbi:MAG: arsenite S-adenosylmethyltransferase [Actinobacteria bacterium RBG_13_35_12]|nr:MAG: arsenite S-adenosylmethyltransferase [Actinobacteria bacterium RBG_13_35_12]
MKEKNIKKIVRESYGRIAKQNSSCCSVETSCGCRGNNKFDEISKSIGYADADIKKVPEGSNLGLGCGNPIALASIKEGETVLDLGSGAGFDCFLAANKVGAKGKVIGVDMTQEMLEKARENVLKGGYKNVEFRLGEIDNLPVADNHIDIIISNCVINLTPDKKRVFNEAYRVLKPGGRIMISDMVLLKKLLLPDEVIDVLDTCGSCITGAIMKEEYINSIEESGFTKVEVINEVRFPFDFNIEDATAKEIIKNIDIKPEDIIRIKEDNNDAIASISVYGEKPLK